jgi:hypothetical protein
VHTGEGSLRTWGGLRYKLGGKEKYLPPTEVENSYRIRYSNCHSFYPHKMKVKVTLEQATKTQRGVEV